MEEKLPRSGLVQPLIIRHFYLGNVIFAGFSGRFARGVLSGNRDAPLGALS
jgi:hypothetical protein